MPDETDAADGSGFTSTAGRIHGGQGGAVPADDGDALPQGDPGDAATTTAPTLRNLPEQPIAALYNAMSSDWGEPFAVISRDLTLKKYQGADVVRPMTVDALIALPQGVGVMVMFAHGVFSDGYCIATSHVANAADDQRFASDLKPQDGSSPTLKTFAVPSSPPGAPVRGAASTTNYCITSAFVEKYWAGKFCRDSLAVICSCNVLDGSEASAKDFVATLNDIAHVSYLVGWDEHALTSDMSSAAIFIVDRLLGGNDADAKPVHPPQRPFDIGAVLTDMANYANGAGGALNESEALVSGARLPLAKLAVSARANSAFGLLAPSITHLAVLVEDTKLAIAGCFGDEPKPGRGVVKINDTPVPYDTWQPDQIVCPLLVGDEPAPAAGQSAGVVVVEVDGRPSNAVRLTEWRGKLVFTVKGDGAQRLVCTWSYHLKADLHHFRANPGSGSGCFVEGPVGVFTLHDSSLTYAATGSAPVPDSDPPVQTTWSGSGSLKPFLPGPGMTDPQKTFQLMGTIVRPPAPDLGGCHMLLMVDGGSDDWTYQVECDGDASPAAAFQSWNDFCSDPPALLFEDMQLKLPLDAQMGIAAASYTVTVGDRTCVLSIQPEPTLYPPDPIKGEDESAMAFV